MGAAKSPPWDLDSIAPDLAILIALKEEFRTLAQSIVAGFFSRPNPEFVGDDFFFIGPRGYRCVTTFMDTMGPAVASQWSQRLLGHNPATIVNIGIAAGLHDDLRIGDVIVPREVAAYIENGKVTGRSTPKWEHRGEDYRPTKTLVTAASHLCFKAEYGAWQEDGRNDLAALAPDDRALLDALVTKGIVRKAPEISTMHLASGNFVLASKAFVKWIRAANGNIHAGEMEAAGMMIANEYRRQPAQTLVIRGISDHIDHPKKRGDKIGGGALRGLAMRNAWRLLCTLMEMQLLDRAQPAAPPPSPSDPPLELRSTSRFVGRKDELAELGRLLVNSKAHKVIVAISGMPGVGKSYLADHFANAQEAHFAGGVLRLSLNPDEQRSVEALAEELASKLEPKAKREELPVRLAEALVLIENVDSDRNVRLVAGLLASLPRARVIASGRVSGFGEQAGWQPLPLRGLDEPTALELFAAWGCGANSIAERQALGGLARRLGFLPLALALAGGYIRAGGTVADFEQELRETRLALAPRDGAVLIDEQAARQIIRSSFDISLRVFEREAGTEAREAFAAMGAALTQEFGESLGRAVAKLEESEFRKLRQTAIKLSLLERVPSPTAPRYQFHPLIAEFLSNEFEDSAEAFARQQAWFEPRMLSVEHRDELVVEQASLVAWLEETPDSLASELSGKYEDYGKTNGPYLAFAGLHERASKAAEGLPARSFALHRLAHVLWLAGEFDRSKQIALENAELCGDEDPRVRAIALGQVADILFARGDLDEALRIRTEEQLPAFERLGDVRERAATLGRVADILYRRGDLEEALRIRTEEELPVYERLGDVRERAVALGKVADILFDRGDLEEALRIRTEEELPVYERLGNVRSRAVTLGNVADILYRRGDLDEALRIRTEEELPVYERLGDVRSRAITLGQVADILFERGDLDEALRIRTEEELPVYERLGDVHGLIVARAKIAQCLARRGHEGDLSKAIELVEQSIEQARPLRLREVPLLEEILAELRAR